MPRVCIIASESEQSKKLRAELIKSGFDCFIVPNNNAAIEQITRQPFQVMLLDKQDREKSSHALSVEARELLTPLAEKMGARIQVVEMPPGPPVLQTVVAEIYGPDDATRRQTARDMEAMFMEVEDLVDACAFTIRVLGFVNAPAIMQRTVASLQHVSIDIAKYARLRDLLYDGLQEAGYECTRPQGAFYLFPKTPAANDVDFVKTLMEYRILTVPGSGFGRAGYFRLAYCVQAETIERSLPGFRDALNRHAANG